jgi:uncharacterized protein YndB with AHSA1/START domain
MNECDVIIERVFDYPRERVFRAFSDPAVLARWWGPAGFSNTFKVFDFEPEGLWKFTMHGPDGVIYPNESVFQEIVKPERIVFDHTTGHLFRAIFAFAEQDGKTLVHWTMRFPSVDACAKVRDFVTEMNGQNMDRLEAQLGKMNGS